jgi:DNA-binding XRE family transcriptional regulator
MSGYTRVTAYWMNVQRGDDDECWPWTGYINQDGYGEFYFDGRMVGAHELAVTFTTGEQRLPELETCHSCDNRPCCNPRHLRFDTHKSNVEEMLARGRQVVRRELSDEQVRLIRRRREAGAAQADLAVQFGVSSAYISMIVNGKKRAEAGGPIATQREYRRAS